MTVLRDLSDLRDDLENAGGLPAWRTPSTTIGRQAQALARTLRDRWVNAELAATTVRSEIAKHAAEVAAQRATNERLTAEIDALRALPVIATCEQCTSGEASSSGHMVCADDPRDVQREIERPFTPPSWCPLRGAR